MIHLAVLPILLPLLAAALLLLLERAPIAVQRAIAFAATVAALAASALLLAGQVSGDILTYALGDWPAPYGILLVVDRLSALMLLVVFLLALPALLMAGGGGDLEGRHVYPLFQLQLCGLAGAFLTGDIFNLFVFFEILLLASYALLVHGGGAARTRAGLAYVALNLMGSALFLVAVAFIYGTLGTLNMADLARVLPDVAAADRPLVRAAFAILIGVFLMKAALLPMAFWLPRAYATAGAPALILFAILTKVGVVSLLRLTVTVLGSAPATQGLLLPWLPVLAIGTIALGTLGLIAASRLMVAAANLLLISSGMLLFAVAFSGPGATAALLYYLWHSTFATAGFLLLARLVSDRRSEADHLVPAPIAGNRLAIGAVFALFAVAVAGLPPLSGFLAKLMLMQAVAPPVWQPVWWAALLLSGFGVTVVLARAASLLFWQPQEPLPALRLAPSARLAIALLAAASPLLVVAAAPISAFATAAAGQLHARAPYLEAVLGSAPPTRREQRP